MVKQPAKSEVEDEYYESPQPQRTIPRPNMARATGSSGKTTQSTKLTQLEKQTAYTMGLSDAQYAAMIAENQKRRG